MNPGGVIGALTVILGDVNQEPREWWEYVVITGVLLVTAACLILFAFWYGRKKR